MSQTDDCRPAGRAAGLLRCEQDKVLVQRWIEKHGLKGDLFSVKDLGRLRVEVDNVQQTLTVFES